MKRLWVVLCALCFLSGCGPQWEPFWRDVNGDNQKMRYGSGSSDQSSWSLKPQN